MQVVTEQINVLGIWIHEDIEKMLNLNYESVSDANKSIAAIMVQQRPELIRQSTSYKHTGGLFVNLQNVCTSKYPRSDNQNSV